MRLPSRLRVWLRTDDGKLIVGTAALAILTLLVWLFVSLRAWEAQNQEAEVMQKISSPKAKMLRDLHAGMKHDPFLRKYGKATKMERRPDGRYWLRYDGVSVTFTRSGSVLEYRDDRVGEE